MKRSFTGKIKKNHHQEYDLVLLDLTCSNCHIHGANITDWKRVETALWEFLFKLLTQFAEHPLTKNFTSKLHLFLAKKEKKMS